MTRTICISLLLCSAALGGPIPDPHKTPGAWRDISVAEICGTKWGKDARAVTASMKAKVFAAYGYSGNDDPRCNNPNSKAQRCEIDHRKPRELGGADVIPNLWVQPYAGTCNAHDKDRLENAMHKLVCAHSVSLDQARAVFDAPDWREGFKKYVDPKGCGDAQ